MNQSVDEHASWKSHLETLPSVQRDPGFWAMTSTQFLGAFNDNLFKQLVLLLCTDLYRRSSGGGDTYQTFAGFFFALPFVMFSGFAGYLSDLFRKRNVIIICKVAEILVMMLGALAFYSMSIYWLFVVLFMMGVHSAFFGPSKYGALPEMFRERDLPYINGVIIMTTFLAIILGTALAGPLMDSLGESRIWLTSTACILTAVLGTITALFVRSTPVANPGLKFRWATLAIDGPTWRLMRRDKCIRNVLYVISVFWMIGAVIQFSANAFGRYQLGISRTRTGWMLVGVAAGIAIGCVIAARVSRGRVRLGVYRVGNFLLVLSLSAIGILFLRGPNHEKDVLQVETRLEEARQAADAAGVGQLIVGELSDAERAKLTEAEARIAQAEKAVDEITNREMTAYEWTFRVLFFFTGISAGLFTVPLQTLLQVRPPDSEKGRVIAAMNFMTWIGILLASGAYFILSALCSKLGLPQGVQFAACAIVMAMMYLYRLDDRGESTHPPPASFGSHKSQTA